MAFLPEHDLGLVALTNLDSSPFTDPYVLNLLLNELGINRGVPGKALAFNDGLLRGIVEVGRQSAKVDLKAITPYFGFYERGYTLERDGGGVQLRLGPRVWPLRQTGDGGYVMAHGFLLRNPVKLSRGVDGTPQVEIVGFERLRRITPP
jgi:hypothetical protein